MRIDVTRKHIIFGKPSGASTCAVALAIHEVVPDDYVAIIVTEARIGEAWYSGAHCRYKLPREVQDFIIKFDSTLWLFRWFMKPFSFELDI